MLKYEITLNLFDYIDKDDDYIAWSAADDGISHIGSMFSKTSVAGRNYPVSYLELCFVFLKVLWPCGLIQPACGVRSSARSGFEPQLQ